MGKDWTSSKTNFLSLSMLGPPPSFSVRVTAVLMGKVLSPRCGRTTDRVTEWSRKGAGLVSRELGCCSRATTDSPSGRLSL